MTLCKLGRYLGPSPDIGQAMSLKILTSKATVIVRTSVLPLSVEDKNSNVVHTQIQEFDKVLAVALGDRIIGIPAELDEHEEDDRQFVPYADDEKGEDPVIPEADIFDHDTYHRFLAARVSIPVGGELKSGTVVKHKQDEDGLFIGIANKNPILDTSLYEVEFDDGLVEAFTVNVIAENIT
jgi:hypothetical protein